MNRSVNIREKAAMMVLKAIDKKIEAKFQYFRRKIKMTWKEKKN